MTQTASSVCTAEEFLEREDLSAPVELVKGQVIQMPPPFPRHGTICANVAFYLQLFVRQHDLGRVMTNDVCIVTGRSPDTVRGADVAYVSYSRIPKGPLADGYLPAQPELIVEVRSPGDRWNELRVKIQEYLEAGTPVVCVVDPMTETAHVCRLDCDEQQFSIGDTLVFDDILPGFAVPVRQLFE